MSHLCNDTPECIEAEDADQVLGVMNSGIHLDLILLDLFMPGSNGLDLLRELCSHPAGVPVVVLSALESAETMREALDSGASGYVSKTTPHSVMLQALRLVLAGGVYVPAALLAAKANEHESQWSQAESGAPRSDRRAPEAPVEQIDGLEQLTPRQREVLARICQGQSNKMIARELGFSEFTVKAHVVAILRTLGVSNRIEAASMARKLGFPG